MAQRKLSRNLTSRIISGQVTGRGLKMRELPSEFVDSVDQRLDFNGIPILLRKLDDSSAVQRFRISECASYMKELCELLSAEMECEYVSFQNEKCKRAKVFDVFGGIEIVLGVLFYPVAYGWKKSRPKRNHQLDKLNGFAVDLLHHVCSIDDHLAIRLAKKTEVVFHTFVIMESKGIFMNAAQLLEDLLGARKSLICLSEIGNLGKLLTVLDQNQIAYLCRVLAYTLSDMESVEERSTLLAQDEQEKSAMCQKDIADQNQATLIGFQEFLPKLVKLACKSLSAANSMWPSGFGADNENFMEWLGFHAFLNVLGDSLEDEDPVVPSLTTSMKMIHELVYKVEVFYVLCLFLTGKHKVTVQKRLSQLRLIPGMCNLFDKLMWLRNHNSRLSNIMDVSSTDHDCTPDTALRIQFLRLVHSFCDRHENKHLMLTPSELDELQELYEQNDLEVPESLHQIDRRLCCVGEKGLLSKVLEVLLKSPSTAPLRFWLSRAIEGFLRGRASIGDQLFLIKRGLLEHLVDHITSQELKPKEILQSSFDLLGELMKFNSFAFQRFNCAVNEKQFEKFISVLTANVIDSNMLIRCLVLSQEHFVKNVPQAGVCRLGALINNFDQRMFLLYKLINTITVSTLTQENVSCLNTTLVFLMFAYKQGQLPIYLRAFVKEENMQRNPGFIMLNLRTLLEFWKAHYLKRGKDCSALEQSSCIDFENWKEVVDILVNDNAASNTSVLHYLPAAATRTM